MIKHPEPPEHREELGGLSYLQAQLECPSVSFFHFRGRIAFGGYQRRAQSDLQGEFLLDTLGSIRQGLEQLQPFGKVADRFLMSRALGGSLSRLLPIGNGLRAETRLSVMMGQQFRLSLFGLKKPFL